MNSYHVYTLGRLFNLLLTCVCLYFAIKMAPRFKMLLGLVFLLPMAVQQASGYSYDCYVNALTVLVVGYWLKLIFEEGPIALKDIIGITIFTILQAPAKTIYAFAVFLAFLVFSNRFNKKWQNGYLVVLLL